MRPPALAFLLCWLGGCVQPPPPGRWDAAAGRLCSEDVCYQVGRLGGDWQVAHREGGAIGFYSATVGGVIESNATCRDDADAASLEVLTRHLLIGYTDQRVRCVERRALDWREARRTVVDAKLDGVPMTMDLWVMKRDGCVYDLAFVAPPDSFAMGAVDFARFVGGFGAGPRRS